MTYSDVEKYRLAVEVELQRMDKQGYGSYAVENILDIIAKAQGEAYDLGAQDCAEVYEEVE